MNPTPQEIASDVLGELGSLIRELGDLTRKHRALATRARELLEPHQPGSPAWLAAGEQLIAEALAHKAINPEPPPNMRPERQIERITCMIISALAGGRHGDAEALLRHRARLRAELSCPENGTQDRPSPCSTPVDGRCTAHGRPMVVCGTGLSAAYADGIKAGHGRPL